MINVASRKTTRRFIKIIHLNFSLIRIQLIFVAVFRHQLVFHFIFKPFQFCLINKKA